MSLHNLSAGKNVPQSFNVVIEIAANSGAVKYEVDKESGVLAVDRFMTSAMNYPANYGYIPQTLCDDGDPLDVLVLTPEPLIAGCVIECRALGVLQMTDEKGGDAKLLAVPTKKICPFYENINNLDDVDALTCQKIKHFFEQYKALEKGKWVTVDGWQGIEEAIQTIEQSIVLYKQN